MVTKQSVRVCYMVVMTTTSKSFSILTKESNPTDISDSQYYRP